jgi:hypothetical protein
LITEVAEMVTEWVERDSPMDICWSVNLSHLVIRR